MVTAAEIQSARAGLRHVDSSSSEYSRRYGSSSPVGRVLPKSTRKMCKPNYKLVYKNGKFKCEANEYLKSLKKSKSKAKKSKSKAKKSKAKKSKACSIKKKSSCRKSSKCRWVVGKGCRKSKRRS
jgi:hypothetical protein